MVALLRNIDLIFSKMFLAQFLFALVNILPWTLKCLNMKQMSLWIFAKWELKRCKFAIYVDTHVYFNVIAREPWLDDLSGK